MKNMPALTFVCMLQILVGSELSSAQNLEESLIAAWKVDVDQTKKLTGIDKGIVDVIAQTGLVLDFKRDGTVVITSISPAERQVCKWKRIKVNEARQELVAEFTVDSERYRIMLRKDGMILLAEQSNDVLKFVFKRTKKKR
ncbi:MAG: hypothetical protein IH991_19345 [Planctomycetes bacterium]|nr:hypothetical protein [Planctomycetota bacterium]